VKTKRRPPVSFAQQDVLDHLKRNGPTWWGAFRGNVVAALVRHGRVEIGNDQKLRIKA
jgi:hypothetical protein